MQQKLQISLNNNVGLDEADPPVRISTHNPVSTGLRLSYDDDERNSSVTSSGSMNASSSVMLSLTDDIKMELGNQKREFDQYLKTQVIWADIRVAVNVSFLIDSCIQIHHSDYISK